MKYVATLSTKYSTGQFDTVLKEDIMDIIESWFLQYGVDPKMHRDVIEIDDGKGVPVVTSWSNDKVEITCNFDATNNG